MAVKWTDPGTPLQIQIETAGIHGVASITTELAAAFGNNMVTFAIGRPISLHVDGAPNTALHVSGNRPSRVGRWRSFRPIPIS